MICEQCKDEGKRSKVYPGMSYVTALGWQPFYDEDGNFVNDDPNITTTTYRCSNSHRWQTKTSRGATHTERLDPDAPDSPPVGRVAQYSATDCWAAANRAKCWKGIPVRNLRNAAATGDRNTLHACRATRPLPETPLRPAHGRHRGLRRAGNTRAGGSRLRKGAPTLRLQGAGVLKVLEPDFECPRCKSILWRVSRSGGKGRGRRFWHIYCAVSDCGPIIMDVPNDSGGVGHGHRQWRCAGDTGQHRPRQRAGEHRFPAPCGRCNRQHGHRYIRHLRVKRKV